MVVLFLALMAMLAVIPYGSSSVQTNSIHAQAVAVAQQFLDDERNAELEQGVPMPMATTAAIDPGQSFVSTTGKTNVNYGNFTVEPNGCVSIDFTGSTASGVNAYSCSVTVSWTESGALRSVTEQSDVVAAQS